MTLVTVHDKRRRRVLGRVTGLADRLAWRDAQALVRVWGCLNGVRIVRCRRTSCGDVVFTGRR